MSVRMLRVCWWMFVFLCSIILSLPDAPPESVSQDAVNSLYTEVQTFALVRTNTTGHTLLTKDHTPYITLFLVGFSSVLVDLVSPSVGSFHH